MILQEKGNVMKNKIGKEKTVIIKNVVIALLVIVFFAGILTISSQRAKLPRTGPPRSSTSIF